VHPIMLNILARKFSPPDQKCKRRHVWRMSNHACCFTLLEQSPDGATGYNADSQTIRVLAATSSHTGLSTLFFVNYAKYSILKCSTYSPYSAVHSRRCNKTAHRQHKNDVREAKTDRKICK